MKKIWLKCELMKATGASSLHSFVKNYRGLNLNNEPFEAKNDHFNVTLPSCDEQK